MSRVNVTQSDVMQSVIRRLRQELSLNDRQCFFVLNDQNGMPAIPVGVIGDGCYVTVAPGESSIDDGLAVGEPIEQVTEYATVHVTGLTRIHLDSTGHDEKLLLDETRGLLSIKHRILQAMCGQDLTLENGNTFLRELVRPVAIGSPQAGTIGENASLTVGFVTILFSVPFDWDLDDEPEEEDSSGSSSESSSST